MKVLTRIGYSGEKGLIALSLDQGSSQIQVLRTRFHKGILLIAEHLEFQHPQVLQAYLRHWPASPLLLSLQNTQALEKWMPQSTEDKIKAVLGVRVDNPQEFIYEEIQGSSGHSLVSLIRKEQLTTALEVLGSHQERVIGCFLSKASACFLFQAMPQYIKGQVYFLEEGITYAWNGELSQDTSQAIPITISEIGSALDIQADIVTLYAHIFQFYLGKQRIHGFSTLTINRKRQHTRSQISKGLCLSLGILLFLLSSTFFTQAFFTYQHKTATRILTAEASTLAQIENSQATLEEKVAFFKGSQEKALEPSKIAWYTDQVSAIAPKEVGFDRLVYHPTSKELKKIDMELESQEFDLLIQGESSHAQALTHFSLFLQEKSWVEKAEIFESSYDYQTQRLRFLLLLTFSHGEIS